MQLKSLGNLSIAKDIIKVSPNDFNVISNAIKNLSSEYKVAALSSSALSDAQKIQILINQGLTAEEAKQAIATATVSNAEKEAAVTTGGLSAAFKGLAASIGISTAALGAFMAIIAGVAIALIAFKKYDEYIDELVSSTSEASAEWAEQSKSLNENIAKIKELKDALASGILSEEEATQTKSDLLDIQNQLKDSYGEQVAGIDLVNGAYETQIGLLEQLSQAEANAFLLDNAGKGADIIKSQMEQQRYYNLGTYNLSDDIIDLISKYEGLSATKNGALYTINFTGDVSEADETIHSFYNELSQMDSDIAEIFSDKVSSTTANISSVLEEYQEAYDSILKAEMYSQGTGENSPAALLNEYAQAVENYNNALSEGNETTISDASKAFEEVQSSVDLMLNSSDNSKYTQFFDEVESQLNTTTIALENFKNAYSDSQFSNFKDVFKDYDAFDLKSLDINRNASTAQYILSELVNEAVELGVVTDKSAESISTVVDLLAEMGIVSDSVSLDEITANLGTSLSELLGEESDVFVNQVDEYITKVNELNDALTNYKDGNFSNADINSLIKKFPELEGHTDDLDDAIIELMGNMNTDMVNEFGSQFDNVDSEEARDELYEFMDAVLELGSTVGATQFSIDIDAETESMENLYSAIEESTSATGLSSESITNLKERYQSLADFNAVDLFEKTANGIHLNTKELRELESEYKNQTKSDLDTSLESLKEKYELLTGQINNCSDATRRADLYAQRDNIITQY